MALLTDVRAVQASTWRGLVVAPESRCSEYKASDYSYSQSVELQIIRNLGGIWSPYTGRNFKDRFETDIEHIIARSEAHDSGLCASSVQRRREFSRDLLNLTLASPAVNRHQKRALDAADWLPDLNRCWFADRVVRIRQKYKLTIDTRERRALELVLSSCTSTDLVSAGGKGTSDQTGRAKQSDGLKKTLLKYGRDALTKTLAGRPLDKYDDNGNGRITCAEARRHGIAPVRRGHPAYPYMRDGDGDGVVCE